MIYFTGDVSLTDGYFNVGFGVGSNIARGMNPFMNIQKNSEDIWVGNFEGVASVHSCNKGYRSNVFRIDPELLGSIKLFDVWGVANNHAMQHGEEAYWQTVNVLKEQGYKIFGTKLEKSSSLQYKKQTVCLTGMSLRIDEFTDTPCYWHNPEYRDIEVVVKSLSQESFKVLFVHWGNEYINRPSVAQKKLAHWLVDIGFDLIIGMHPHVLQGYEDYKDARIYYSLGNFVFDMPSTACRYGAIVGLDFDEQGKPIFSEEYVHIDNNGYPCLVDSHSVPTVYTWAYLNECLSKEDNSEPYHNEALNGYLEYRKANRRTIIKNMIYHPKSMVGIIGDFVKRKL